MKCATLVASAILVAFVLASLARKLNATISSTLLNITTLKKCQKPVARRRTSSSVPTATCGTVALMVFMMATNNITAFLSCHSCDAVKRSFF